VQQPERPSEQHLAAHASASSPQSTVQRMLAALQRWQQPWPLPLRALFIGMLLYLLLPIYGLPTWQWQGNDVPDAELSRQLNKITDFHQQYGDSGWPALRAQLQLNRLAAYEAELTARQSSFATQLRDDNWAEATEFIIQHVSQNIKAGDQVGGKAGGLALQRCECRNNLCALAFTAPEGLTPALQAQVLQLASALKTAGLEYHQLKQQRQTLHLELKSDKTLVFYFWQRWQLAPRAKAQWQQQIRDWLALVATQPAEPENAGPADKQGGGQ